MKIMVLVLSLFSGFAHADDVKALKREVKEVKRSAKKDVKGSKADPCTDSALVKIDFDGKSALGNKNQLLFTSDGFLIHSTNRPEDSHRGYSYRFVAGENYCYSFDVSHGKSGGGSDLRCPEHGTPVTVKDEDGQDVAEVRQLGRGAVEIHWNVSDRKGEFKRSEESISVVGMLDVKNPKNPIDRVSGGLSVTAKDANGNSLGTIHRAGSSIKQPAKELSVDLKKKENFELAGCPQAVVANAGGSGSDGPRPSKSEGSGSGR